MLRTSTYLLALAFMAVACAKGSTVIDAGPDQGDDAAPITDALPGPDRDPDQEICDGVDNNNDQFIDEGTDEELCGTVVHGTPRCNGLLGCEVATCESGYYDVDTTFDNGCECAQEPSENNDNLCASAVDLGDFPDNGSSLEISGNVVPASDVDVYRFRAVDSLDDTCDTFHVRALFLSNPDDAYVLDAWRKGCETAQWCDSVTDMQWYTNFANGTTSGECLCGNVDGIPHCIDDSAEFHVQVRRKDGLPLSCGNYLLEISNGKYPAP
jgi:hypothetical protein